MALKRKPRKEETAEIEEKVEEVVKEAHTSKPVPEAQGTPEAQVPQNTKSGGLPMVAGAATFALEELRNGFIPDFGTLSRLKAGQGDIVDQDDNSLGKFVDVEVYSFNSRFTISPNDDDAEADVVRYSLDGVVLDDGSGVTVKDYLAELKQDWPDANVKEYFEVVGPLLGSDEESPDLDMVVQLQLSPTSRKSFENHRTQMTFKIARGKATADDSRFVRFTATAKSSRGKKWTMLAASQSLLRG